jgi:TAZ zinc finger
MISCNAPPIDCQQYQHHLLTRLATLIPVSRRLQNCVLGQKCPHTGCQEAKLLHLHLKTCHAVGDAVCPMGYHGCDQSRKLLAHHRRCRQLRLAAKARSPTSSGGGGGATALSSSVATGSAAATHHCLVCSLVARQARTFLLTPNSTSSATTTTAKRGKPGQRFCKQVTYAASATPGGDSLSRLYGIAKQMDTTATTTTVATGGHSAASIMTSQQRRARSKSDGDMLKCDTIMEESEILQEKLEELRDASC